MIHLSHIIRQESLEAYIHPDNQPKFGKQAMTIFRLLQCFPTKGFTRNEISVLLNIKINAVCGRVNELIKAEWIEEYDKRRDQYSNMKNNVIRIKKR